MSKIQFTNLLKFDIKYSVSRGENFMEIVQQQELQERLSDWTKRFADSLKKLTESLRRAGETFGELNAALRNSELGEEAKKKISQKKGDILRYATQTLGMVESDIHPYLTDEIVLQALCYEYSPHTVVECLILDKNFKQAWERTKNEYVAESMKNLGLR